MTDDRIAEISFQVTAAMHAEAPGFRIIPHDEFDLRFARAIEQASRRAALEEAAKVCDEKSKDYDADFEPARAAAAWHCVNAIRALAASDRDGGKS